MLDIAKGHFRHWTPLKTKLFGGSRTNCFEVWGRSRWLGRSRQTRWAKLQENWHAYIAGAADVIRMDPMSTCMLSAVVDSSILKLLIMTNHLGGLTSQQHVCSILPLSIHSLHCTRPTWPCRGTGKICLYFQPEGRGNTIRTPYDPNKLHNTFSKVHLTSLSRQLLRRDCI